MANSKVTVTIPVHMTSQIIAIKDELKTTISAIYQEALGLYLEKIEIEKWKKGAIMASQDKKYISLAKEFGSDKGDIYEY